jgi:hypothetical protein
MAINSRISESSQNDINEELIQLAKETVSELKDFDGFNGISKKDLENFVNYILTIYDEDPSDDQIFNNGKCEGGINY